MKYTLSASDILSDIEFEIAQGTISRDDLGEGIQTVKKHQSRMRSEVFLPSRKAWDGRDVASRQFQINDMHLTLMQEMVAAIRAVRLDMRQLSQWQTGARSARAGAEARTAEEKRIEIGDGLFGRSPHDLEDVMRPETLKVEVDVRPTRIPLVGGLLHRVRVGLHRIAQYYTIRLASKQTQINWLYSDWILHLYWLKQRQEQDIESLRGQVEALQTRLAGLEHGARRTDAST